MIGRVLRELLGIKLKQNAIDADIETVLQIADETCLDHPTKDTDQHWASQFPTLCLSLFSYSGSIFFMSKQVTNNCIPFSKKKSTSTTPSKKGKQMQQLITHGHRRNLSSSYTLISPVLIAVKKIGSEKLALDSKEINISKNIRCRGLKRGSTIYKFVRRTPEKSGSASVNFARLMHTSTIYPLLSGEERLVILNPLKKN